MKAITISQPFASLIANREKWIENRSWETRYRGPLAIHAGKGTQYMTKSEIAEAEIPYGQIIAIAKLATCVRTQWAEWKIKSCLRKSPTRRFGRTPTWKDRGAGC